MFRMASVLLRVTTVGLDITFVLDWVFSAEMITLKSEAEKTAVATRLVLPPFTRELSALIAEVMVVLPVVPLVLPEVTALSGVAAAATGATAATAGDVTAPVTGSTTAGMAGVPGMNGV